MRIPHHDGIEVHVVGIAAPDWWWFDENKNILYCSKMVWEIILRKMRRPNAPVIGVIGRCQSFVRRKSGVIARCERSGRSVFPIEGEEPCILCDKHVETGGDL
jgi:hypothetical protein